MTLALKPVYSLGELVEASQLNFRTLKKNLSDSRTPMHKQTPGRPTLVFLHDIKHHYPKLYKSLLLTFTITIPKARKLLESQGYIIKEP